MKEEIYNIPVFGGNRRAKDKLHVIYCSKMAGYQTYEELPLLLKELYIAMFGKGAVNEEQ
jgi:hypothetical protein